MPSLIILLLAIGLVRVSTFEYAALEHAVANGDAEKVGKLLTNGASVHFRTAAGATLLHIAAQSGQHACTSLLLMAGVDKAAVDTQGATPLHLAALHGHTQVAALLLAHDDNGGVRGTLIEARDGKQSTPLHLACLNGHSSTVDLLLGRGASLEARGREGATPLIYACTHGQSAVAEQLLKAGASARATTAHGTTALHAAVLGGYAGTVATLLESQVSLEVVSADGYTAASLAAAILAQRFLVFVELNLEYASGLLRKDVAALQTAASDDGTNDGGGSMSDEGVAALVPLLLGWEKAGAAGGIDQLGGHFRRAMERMGSGGLLESAALLFKPTAQRVPQEKARMVRGILHRTGLPSSCDRVRVSELNGGESLTWTKPTVITEALDATTRLTSTLATRASLLEVAGSVRYSSATAHEHAQLPRGVAAKIQAAAAADPSTAPTLRELLRTLDEPQQSYNFLSYHPEVAAAVVPSGHAALALHDKLLRNFSRASSGVSIGRAGSWLHMHQHSASLSVQISGTKVHSTPQKITPRAAAQLACAARLLPQPPLASSGPLAGLDPCAALLPAQPSGGQRPDGGRPRERRRTRMRPCQANGHERQGADGVQRRAR